MTNVCGTGGWGGPKPGDPDNVSILTATPAFGGIDVSWTLPTVNSFAVAHVVLYRGLLDTFDAALQLVVVGGDSYYDKIDTNYRYYYWITIVSINGTVGELIGPASAVARSTIEQTIEQLTGKIDAGVLSQSLKAELDKISILRTDLLSEITARENSSITLAQALADVDAGVAEALSFVGQEISTRTTNDAALAETLNLTAVTLGDNIAAATTALQTTITTVDGKVTDIGALYTAKVQVNGLIGGFGVYNNGSVVQAGFDVDTFWVGRTQANKKKPFIINASGDTYIDSAFISTLTADKLTAGSSAVASGKTFGLATANTINTIYGVGYFNSGAPSTAGVLTVSTTSSGILSATTTSLPAGGFYNANSTAYNSFKTTVALASSTYAGEFYNVVSSKYASLCGATYAVAYSGGAAGTFTGAHDGLILKTDGQPSVGDLLVDVTVYAKPNVYDSLCVNKVSSEANQKGVIGVFAQNADESHVPSALTIPTNNVESGSFFALDPQYTDIDLYQKVVINALGEGLINVCGEGGSIEVGDLIVTSSIAGKGMKQADDIIRGYTVAKARESVTFNANEIKQIACIYVAG